MNGGYLSSGGDASQCSPSNIEDGNIYRDQHGNFHALFHERSKALTVTHAYSLDGVSWTFSSVPPYDRTMRFNDGSAKNITQVL